MPTALFRRPIDVIDVAEVAVMCATTVDEVAAIQMLWPRFETLVGLHGRRMYALIDTAAQTYTTCTPRRDDDQPEDLGLSCGVLPGGRFRRGRLVGEPPELYTEIGPAMAQLESAGPVDATRPLVEFYRRRDAIDLWVPIPHVE